MAERIEFEMTDEDKADLLKSMQPVPYIVVGGIGPTSPQENANNAWKRLGAKMGFAHMTVKPVAGKNDRFFTAVKEGEAT